jgi:hypothetical protein
MGGCADHGVESRPIGVKVFAERLTPAHPIQLFVRASNEEGVRMNVRYRVELSQTERAELTALLKWRQACGAQAQAGADIAGRRCRGQRR